MEAAAAAGRAAARASAAPEPEAELPESAKPVLAWMGSDPKIKAALEAVGCKAGASEDELRKKFHRAALRWHPDKNSSAEAAVKFQEISDAYTLLTEVQLGGAAGVSAGARTVVTAPGNWVGVAQALDEVCGETERWPLLVDGTGDGVKWLEMLSGGGTDVVFPGEHTSKHPSLLMPNGSQLTTTCRRPIRLKPFPIECPIFCQAGVPQSKYLTGTPYCSCHFTSVMAPPPWGLNGDGGIAPFAGSGGGLMPPKDLLNILVDCLVGGKPFIIDLSAEHHGGNPSKKLGDLRMALDGVRRHVMQGVRRAAGEAEQLADSMDELSVRREERSVPRLEKEAKEAKDKALLAMLSGKRGADGEWEGEAAEAVQAQEAAEARLQQAQAKAVGSRQQRLDKLEAKEQSAAAQASHRESAKALRKTKPQKPKKGPDSSILCFNQEVREEILKEQPGLSTGRVGGLLRQRWMGLSMKEQQAWEVKATANKEAYKEAYKEYEKALADWEGQEKGLAASAPEEASGPKVDAEFLRRNFKPWLMEADGLFLALCKKTLHLAEQYRPLFLAAEREDQLAGLSDEEASPTRRFRMIVLTTVDCVPLELESKLLEVRTVRSAEHLTNRAKAEGMLEQAVRRVLDNADVEPGSSTAVYLHAEDNAQFNYVE